MTQLQKAQKWLNKVHTTTVRVQLKQIYIYFLEIFILSIKLQQFSDVLKRRKVAQSQQSVEELTEERTFCFSLLRFESS